MRSAGSMHSSERMWDGLTSRPTVHLQLQPDGDRRTHYQSVLQSFFHLPVGLRDDAVDLLGRSAV